MAIRRNITALTAACVGLAVLAACLVAYTAVRHELYAQIDDSLREVRFIAAPRPVSARLPRVVPGDVRFQRPLLDRLRGPGPRKGGPPGYVQIISRDGRVQPLRGGVRLPVDEAVRRIARTGRGASAPRTVTVGDTRLRLVTFPAPTVGAIEVARSLDGTDRVLARLRVVLLFVLLGGVALAVLLARRVGGRFSDVLGDLEHTNAALDASVTAQRQLVADASHELRTPVTSLRTNVEVLLDGAELDADERAQILGDVREQAEELSALVADVIELARGDVQGAAPEDVRLDELVGAAVARARRHAPGDVAIELEAQPVVVAGVPERLGRAVNNLLDNAVRHAPPGTAVEVTVGPGGVTVRDHGAGVDPEDAPHLFDRFYRGAQDRGSHGTGLGLAIVRQVAEAHGGAVSVADAPGGGAEFRLSLPGDPARAPASR